MTYSKQPKENMTFHVDYHLGIEGVMCCNTFKISTLVWDYVIECVANIWFESIFFSMNFYAYILLTLVYMALSFRVGLKSYTSTSMPCAFATTICMSFVIA